MICDFPRCFFYWLLFMSGCIIYLNNGFWHLNWKTWATWAQYCHKCPKSRWGFTVFGKKRPIKYDFKKKRYRKKEKTEMESSFSHDNNIDTHWCNSMSFNNSESEFFTWKNNINSKNLQATYLFIYITNRRHQNIFDSYKNNILLFE